MCYFFNSHCAAATTTESQTGPRAGPNQLSIYLWDACDAAVRRFEFPPQKYLFPEGEAENALIDVAYTLVRPGPCVECHRVGGCDATGQGCRTKALLPHRATCHRLAAEIDNTRS